MLSIQKLQDGDKDLNHVADFATTKELVVTDRAGNTKPSLQGIIADLKAFNSRGAWGAITVYAVKDLVSISGAWYACVVAHTSGAVFAADIASKWRLYQGLTSGDLGDAGDQGKGASLVGYKGATVANVLDTVIGGDQKPLYKNKLIIFCGDSTTEIAQAMGGLFDRLTQYYAAEGMPLQGIAGVVNYGMSSYTLSAFVNAEESPNFVGASESNIDWNYKGIKKWGVWGGISLADAVKTPGDIYVLCYGINDLILNARGNLPLADIISYLSGLLSKAVEKLRVLKPLARIILRVPAPMTSRPYNQTGFPSQAVYPAFGQDLMVDSDLVTKWNSALYKAYYAVAQKYRFVEFFDTWELVYGNYDTNKLSADKNAYMKDLVHPSPAGFAALADGFVQYLTGSHNGVSLPRVKLADLIAPYFSGVPVDYYANYPLDTNNFTRLFEAAGIVSKTYIELEIPLSTFNRLAGDKELLTWRCGIRTSGKIQVTPENVTDPDGNDKKTRIGGLSFYDMQVGAGLIGLYEDKRENSRAGRIVGNFNIPVQGGVGVGAFSLPRITAVNQPSTYIVTVLARSDDYNHSRMGTYLLTFEDNTPFDYSSAQLICPQISKGGDAPSALTVTVSATGVVNVTINASNYVWHIQYSAVKQA